MDAFLDYLIKKSDINKEFSIESNNTKKKISCNDINYKKILVPNVDNNIVDSFSQLINPMQYITARISRVVNITNSMVEDSPTIEYVLPKFLEFIGDFPLVAHNARFDMGFLISNAHRLGYEINNNVLDTLVLSRKFNKDCTKHNLNYLTKHFNIKLDHAHRAYYDALATCSLYKIIQCRYNNTLVN